MGSSNIELMMETASFEAFQIPVRCNRTAWQLFFARVGCLAAALIASRADCEGSRGMGLGGNRRAAGSQRSPARHLNRCSYLYMAETEKWNREVLLNTIELQSRQDNCQVTVRGRDLHLGRDIYFRTAASV